MYFLLVTQRREVHISFITPVRRYCGPSSRRVCWLVGVFVC